MKSSTAEHNMKQHSMGEGTIIEPCMDDAYAHWVFPACLPHPGTRLVTDKHVGSDEKEPATEM